MLELDFQPLHLPSCSSWYSSVERLWAILKGKLRTHLGILALERRVDKIVFEDLRTCIMKGFDDISEEHRHNIIKANYSDLLKALLK